MVEVEDVARERVDLVSLGLRQLPDDVLPALPEVLQSFCMAMGCDRPRSQIGIQKAYVENCGLADWQRIRRNADVSGD